MDSSTGWATWEFADEPCVVDLRRLFERWEGVTDLRKPKGLRYPLPALLNACCEIAYQSSKSAKARLGRSSSWLSQIQKLWSAILAAKRVWKPLKS
jgi:hypothetical protein